MTNFRSIVFDAVYLLKSKRKRSNISNLTQIFLDFYDERIEMGKYVSHNIILLCPDAMKIN